MWKLLSVLPLLAFPSHLSLGDSGGKPQWVWRETKCVESVLFIPTGLLGMLSSDCRPCKQEWRHSCAESLSQTSATLGPITSCCFFIFLFPVSIFVSSGLIHAKNSWKKISFDWIILVNILFQVIVECFCTTKMSCLYLTFISIALHLYSLINYRY